MSQSTDTWRLVNVKEQSWYQQSLICKKPFQTRFMQKDGSCNVYFKSILGEWESYVLDIFTTLVDIKWRHMLLIFSLSYVLTWLVFGFLYWVIALQHGDLNDLDAAPCTDNVRSFVGAFLFSLETQTTIGYGSRCVTEECPAAIILVTLQSVFSCIIDTFIIGAAMAKMATARKRAQTIRFSYFALVGVRDGKLCLMWRIADFRSNHVVEGNVRAQLLRYHEDHEKGITMEYKDLKLVNDQIILVTPVTVVHVIDQDSPLYTQDRKALAADRFEILVTFIYTGDSTGTSHQSRTSYLPREILWGFRFNNILQAKRKYYKVDCEQFEEMTEYYAPFCSAKQLDINAMPASPSASTRSNGFLSVTRKRPVLSNRVTSVTSMTHAIEHNLSNVPSLSSMANVFSDFSASTGSITNDLSKGASLSSMTNILDSDLAKVEATNLSTNVFPNDLSNPLTNILDTDLSNIEDTSLRSNVFPNDSSKVLTTHSLTNILDCDLPKVEATSLRTNIFPNDLSKELTTNSLTNVLDSNLSKATSLRTNIFPNDLSTNSLTNILHNDLCKAAPTNSMPNVFPDDLHKVPSTCSSILHISESTATLTNDPSKEEPSSSRSESKEVESTSSMTNDLTKVAPTSSMTNILPNHLTKEVPTSFMANNVHVSKSIDSITKEVTNNPHNDLSSVISTPNVFPNDLSKVGSLSLLTDILHISESTASMTKDLSRAESVCSVSNGVSNLSRSMTSVSSLGTLDGNSEDFPEFNIRQEAGDGSYRRVFETLSKMSLES